MFPTKVVEKIKTQSVFNNLYSENLEEYSYGTARQATGNNITWRMRFACRIRQEYAHIHPEYAILIAFPWQQRLRERAPMLRYTYIACLVTLHEILLGSLRKGGQRTGTCRTCGVDANKMSKYI
jgi:hypothetical protein